MRSRTRTTAISAAAASVVVAVGVSTVMLAPAAHAEVISNIAYAPAQPAGTNGHLLDLYLPSGTTPRPLVIWTSGSAWFSDNGKSGASSIANTFNARGYAVAGVSVRSSSQAKFPAQVHDIKAAIRWLRANAGTYRLDPNRIAVMGDSSGGWVANMATMTGGVASLEGTVGTTGPSSAVQAGVAFFGPTDFLQMNAQRPGGQGLDHDSPSSPESQLMGCAIQTCPTQVAQANPITYVDQNDPPIMLLHGQADNLVPHGQSVILYNAIRSRCGRSQFFSVPGAGHGTSDVMSASRFGSQTVRTTSACQETVSTGTPNPNWDTIITWLNTALGVGGPTTSTTTSRPPTTSTTTTTTTSPPPTTITTTTSRPPSTGACRVAYTPNTWNNGFTADVAITNTSSSTVNGWTVTWTWPGNQQITNTWNATIIQSGQQVTARNVGYNGTIAPNASTNFGFQGTYSGTNSRPTQFALNGSVCTIA